MRGRDPAAATRLEGSELPDSQRRAAIAHLRNCETCSAEPPRRSLFGLLGWLLPGLRSFAEPVTSLLPGSAAGLGATAAVVAGVGTLAWQTAPLSKPAGPTVAPVHATSRPTTTNVRRAPIAVTTHVARVTPSVVALKPSPIAHAAARPAHRPRVARTGSPPLPAVTATASAVTERRAPTVVADPAPRNGASAAETAPATVHVGAEPQQR